MTRFAATFAVATVVSLLIVRSVASCCAPEVVAETSWLDPGVRGFRLMVDRQDRVYLFWPRLDFSSHTLSVSIDGGRTWQSRATPIPEGVGDRAGAAVSSAGVLMIAWSDGMSHWTSTSLDQGITFSDATRIGSGSGTFGLDSKVAARGSTFAVAWTRRDADGTLEVDCAVSPDAGSSWHPAVRLNPAGSLVTRDVGLSLVVSKDRVLVAWLAGEVGGDSRHDAWTAISDDVGLTWSPPARINGADVNLWAVAIGIDGAGVHHAVHHGVMDRSQIRVNASTSDGRAWLPGLLLLDAERSHLVEGPRLIVTPSDAVGVAWARPQTEEPNTVLTSFSIAANSWPEPVDVAPESDGAHHVRFATGRAGTVIVHDDYRDDTLECHETLSPCESIYLSKTCDDGASWPVEVRLDSDTTPHPTHSEDPEVAMAPSGRIHVAWINHGLPASPLVEIQHVALDAEAGIRTIELEAATPCRRGRYRFEATGALGSDCPDPTWQWFVDGTLVPGETGRTLDFPQDAPSGRHVVHHEVDCPIDPECGAGSGSVEVLIPEADNGVNGSLGGSLRVTARGLGVRLQWAEAPEHPGYSVYVGEIGSWYSHAPLACHVIGASRLDRVVPAGGRYFLVSPVGCGQEGSLGTDSMGVDRTPGRPDCGPLR